MGDRDDRGNRDSRADRYGGGGDRYYNSNSGHEQREYNTSGGDGGGRYNRARFRNDSDGNYGGGYRPNQRPRHDMSGGYGGGWDTAQQQQQFDPFLMQQNLSGGQDGYNMPFNMNYPPGGNSHHLNSNGGVDPALLSMLQAQGPFPGGQGGDVNNINNNMPFGAPMPGGYNMGGNVAGGGAAMDPADLLQLLLTQQQQQQQPSLHGDYAGSMSNAHVDHSQEARVPQSAPAATRTLPSVEEFVPVVPKSLLSLIRGNDGSASYSGSGGQTSGSPQPQQQQQASSSFGGSGANNNNAGAMVLLEAPKIAPEADRRAREQRRAHVTGFPNGTTREELEEYFRLLLPEVRRLRTEREIRQLAEETGLLKDEGEDALRHIPADANLANIDTVKDINVSQGKVKDFSFVEFRLGDIVEELVDQCTADPQRFLFTSAMDGRSYPLVIRRPRDTVPLTGIDTSKVVLIGFPLSMPADTIKSVFDSFGKLVTFEVKNGYAFGEFAELRDATDFRADVHGLVLGNSVVVALPLYDWLKVLLVREGFDIEIADDDPLSGKYVMQQVRDRAPELLSGGGGGGGGGGLAGGADGAKSTALVLADDPEAASLQLMRELLDMSYTLPDMLARFSGLYPHLRPLYGNAQVSVFPTPILVLLNMFDEEELVYDNTYSQLLADIEEEVEKYGRVRQLIVPRREARPKLPEAPKPGVDYDEENEESREAAMAAYNEAKRNFGAVLGRYMSRQTHPVWGGYGRVFVEYETVDEAAEAQQGIAGKLFGERTVVTSFLFPDLLKEDDDDVDDEKEEAKEEAASVDADALSEKGSDNQQQEEGEEEDGKEEKEGEGDENVDEGVGAAGSGEEDIDAEKSAVSAHAEDID